MTYLNTQWLQIEVLLWYLAAFFTAFTSFINVLIVIFQADQTNRTLNNKFILYSFAITFWSANVFFFSIVRNEQLSYFSAHLLHVGAIFIPILLLNFVLLFFKINSAFSRFELGIGYGFAFLLLIAQIISPSLLITNVEPDARRFSYMMNPGVLYPVWMAVFFYFVISTHIKAFSCYLYSEGDEKRKLAFFVFPSFFAYAGCIAYFFPVYDFYYFPYPWGCFGSMIFSPILAYGIIKHKLLGVDVIIRRTVVFASLFAFTYATFTTITVIGQDLFKDLFGWNEWVAMIPTVLIVTFALRPLENFLTDITERFLFQKKYDYRDLLKTFTNEVLTILDLQKLTEQTVVELSKIIKLESAAMLLLDKDAKVYKIAAANGVKDRSITFSDNDAVVAYLKQTYQHILKEKAVDKMDGHSQLRDDFKKLNAHLCLPIAHHDELIGIVSLGMKKSGEEFIEEDIDILMTLARTLAIAIANAQLFDQLSKTQAEAAQREKMAVIGTLAAGINHEICNPLGIVRGQCEMFLLNLRDGLYNDKSKEDLFKIASDIMNKVIKETDRATGITKKLSGFAKPSKKVENEEVFVEKEADEVLGLIGHDLRLNNITFSKKIRPDFPAIYADKRQIQEVLFNIIRNAAQAMDKKDGRIELSGAVSGDNAVLKISDNGSGIPADKIGQIFNPFFTTKEPGKGTGLGLFIVKQVIERNKGTILVDSQEGVGTTFTLTFPLAVSQAKVLAA